MTSNLVEYNLPKGAYASFDAITLKQLIKDRLTSNSLFTDQNFEGSNLAALADIFAFTYHILLFYYNQNAAESMFDQAELYENMNRIVKSIQYKPTGPQTSILSFAVNADSTLPTGPYTIKRYSFFNINGISYSFTKDISFEKVTSDDELLEAFGEGNLLYQGAYFEYPDYTAIGEEYEIITMANDNINDTLKEVFIDHNNIDVYVKSIITGKWEQWEEVDTLFLQDSTAKVFERRLNENGRYEIKFGNNVSGKKLAAGDIVSIFYLQSNGERGKIGAGVINNSLMLFYNTTRFRNISNDIYSSDTVFLPVNNADKLIFSNTEQSTEPTQYENADEIKINAPKLFSAQKRAVTNNDYKYYIDKNFGNILQSTSVINNSRYTGEFLKYFYDIGLKRPNDDTNVLTNQVNFADACDFNNVYIFCVPKVGAIQNETDPSPLSTAQKQLLSNSLDRLKMTTNEVVLCDPVYAAFDLGIEIVTDSSRTLSEIRSNTSLVLKKDATSRLSNDQIKNLAYSKILNFFSQTNNKLGQLIDMAELTKDIYSVEGVNDIYVEYVYQGTTHTVPGISFVIWNPQYSEDDIDIKSQNIQLPFFRFPFLYEKSKFFNKIKVR